MLGKWLLTYVSIPASSRSRRPVDYPAVHKPSNEKAQPGTVIRGTPPTFEEENRQHYDKTYSESEYRPRKKLGIIQRVAVKVLVRSSLNQAMHSDIVLILNLIRALQPADPTVVDN